MASVWAWPRVTVRVPGHPCWSPTKNAMPKVPRPVPQVAMRLQCAVPVLSESVEPWQLAYLDAAGELLGSIILIATSGIPVGMAGAAGGILAVKAFSDPAPSATLRIVSVELGVICGGNDGRLLPATIMGYSTS